MIVIFKNDHFFSYTALLLNQHLKHGLTHMNFET